MKKIKAFIFKERRLASLIWIWGIIGTIIVAIAAYFLSAIPYLSDIPGYSIAILSLVPTFYFFTLFLSFKYYKKGLRAYIFIFIQFCLQFVVLFVLSAVYSMFANFGGLNYQENTSSLLSKASVFIAEEEYPNDAEIIYVSKMDFGPNSSRNIVIKVDDIELFNQKVLAKYEFKEMVMNIPNIGNSNLIDFSNIRLPPFCTGVKTIDLRQQFFRQTEEVTDPEGLCGKRDVLFTQIDKNAGVSKIMVILPNENLVWISQTRWF